MKAEAENDPSSEEEEGDGSLGIDLGGIPEAEESGQTQGILAQNKEPSSSSQDGATTDWMIYVIGLLFVVGILLIVVGLKR